MASEWYIARNGNKVGPYTSTQLREQAKAGQLRPADMLWKEGNSKWIPASTIKGLFQTAPAPSPPPVAAPASSAAKPAPTEARPGPAPSAAENPILAAINQIREKANAPQDSSVPFWKQRKFLLLVGGGFGTLFAASCLLSGCLVALTLMVGDPVGRFGGIDKNATAKELRKFDLPKDLFGSVHFLSDEKRALVSSHESLDLWDLTNGTKISALKKEFPSRARMGCDLSKDDRYVLAECQGKLTLFDIVGGREQWSVAVNGLPFHLSQDAKTGLVCVDHNRFLIDGQVISIDGKNAAQPMRDFDIKKTQLIYDGCSIQMWDIQERKKAHEFKGPSPGLWGAQASSDGKLVVFCHVDSSSLSKAKDDKGVKMVNELVGSPLRLWDVENEGEVVAFSGHTQGIQCCEISHDNKWVLTGHKDGLLVLWDAQTGKEVRQLKGQTDEVRCLAFAPDARRALSGGKDGTTRLWDTKTGKELHKFGGHKDLVQALAVSLKGDRFLSLGKDNTMRLWQLPAFEAK